MDTQIDDKWANDLDHEFEDIFGTKNSNKCKTKASNEFQSTEDESLKLKLKILQENFEDLAVKNKDLESKVEQMGSENRGLKDEIWELKIKLEQSQAMNKAFLKFTESTMQTDFKELERVKAEWTQNFQKKDKRKSKRSNSNLKNYESKDYIPIISNRMMNEEPLPTFAKWIAAEEMIDQVNNKYNGMIASNQSGVKKLTSFSMYK